MMVVYVLVLRDSETGGDDVFGIYSSREKAERAGDKYRNEIANGSPGNALAVANGTLTFSINSWNVE